MRDRILECSHIRTPESIFKHVRSSLNTTDQEYSLQFRFWFYNCIPKSHSMNDTFIDFVIVVLSKKIVMSRRKGRQYSITIKIFEYSNIIRISE